MKVTSRIAILSALALVVLASASPAFATCGAARLIGGCGGNGCSYMFIEGSPINSAVAGNYWGWGGGAPAIGPGDDNGASPAVAGTPDDWVKLFDPNWYLGGSWGNVGDGCVDNATTPTPKRTVVALSDQVGGKGYFVVLCNEPDTGLNYDFSLNGAPTNFAPIPKPVVTNSAKNAGNVTVDTQGVTAGSLTAGLYPIAASCTGLVQNYKLCWSTQNADLHTAVWTCGSATALDTVSSATAPCGGGQVYVANALVFKDGFESAFVSEPRQVSCDPTLSDRPSNFKVIKKPARGTQQQQ